MNDSEFRSYVFRYIAGYQESCEHLRKIGQIQNELGDLKFPSEVWSLDKLQDDMKRVDDLEKQLNSVRAAHLDARTRMAEADKIIRDTIPPDVWYRCAAWGVRWYADSQTQLKPWAEIINEKKMDACPEEEE